MSKLSKTNIERDKSESKIWEKAMMEMQTYS